MQPSREELITRYSTFSNERLLDILYNKHDYTVEALEAVQSELTKREIGTDEVQQFISDKKAEKIYALEQATVPLVLWEKVLFFFGWFLPGFITMAFRMNYGEDGHSFKLKQSNFFRIAGFISFVLMVIISLILDRGPVLSYILLFIFFGLSYWTANRVYSSKG
ncbi:MAG TPA: hypothetical protein VGK59_22230 [Ohtaekwangia sp.]